MLIPFSKDLRGNEDDNDNDNDNDDDDDNDNDNEDNVVDAGREEFDDVEVERAMREVNGTYTVSASQMKVAKSSLTKVCDADTEYNMRLTGSFIAEAPREKLTPLLDRR